MKRFLFLFLWINKDLEVIWILDEVDIWIIEVGCESERIGIRSIL